jgi:hypothetical protein
MKTIFNQPHTTYAIPNGEGFTALPIVFCLVHMRFDNAQHSAEKFKR